MRLVLHFGDRLSPNRLIHLEPGHSYSVGRSRDSDICIHEFHVNRLHCSLRCGERSAVVRDNQSRLGVRINNTLLTPGEWRQVVPDDVIWLGGTACRVGAVVPIDPLWLVANGGSVTHIARRINVEGDYTALPILADALEDAGCDDVDILTHCRSGRRHTTSCWVIDLLLGRTSMDAAGERPVGSRVRAIMSDVHANLEALQAVLADIEQQGAGDIYCLGDTVGFGPNPVECLKLIRTRCVTILRGFHEQAILFEPDWLDEGYMQEIARSRRQIDAARGAWLELLAQQPPSYHELHYSFFHGTPSNPLNDYFFPEDIYNPRKCERNFALIDRCCFVGHTHLPGIIRQVAAPEGYHYLAAEEVPGGHCLGERKSLVNVGSVGQPRDGDWRACYVILDGETVHFRRVEYDVETTVRKIYDIPDLQNYLGDRLREGR